jgi:pantetheine-phosphate adenylyltransferase
MNQLNRKLAPDIDTVYLMASPQYSFLSSSGVKEMATFGGDVTDLVPDAVAARLKDALQRRHRSE